MTNIELLLQAVADAKDDFESAYSAKTKVSATRARNALSVIKTAALEARKEILAISKGELEACELDVDSILNPSTDTDAE